jgi:hypothetical protein
MSDLQQSTRDNKANDREDDRADDSSQIATHEILYLRPIENYFERPSKRKKSSAVVPSFFLNP